MEPWERDVLKGVSASVAPSTFRSYKKAWADFMHFRANEIGAGPSSPPNRREVLQYLAQLWRRGRAARTLNIHSAAISFFSKAVYSADPCGDFLVRKALEGWRRLQPPSSDGRNPITFDILLKIHKLLGRFAGLNTKRASFQQPTQSLSMGP